MLAKLLSLLVAGKGAAVAAVVIVASASTVSAVTTSTDVQTGMQNVVGLVQTITGTTQSADEDNDNDEDKDEDKDERCRTGEHHGQPVVVAQRNAADKLLRSAFEQQHDRLEHSRGGKNTDHRAANAILQKADKDLRAILTKALNDVAALTLGREGQNKATASPTATPTGTPTATPTGTPTATPTFTPTPTPTFIAPGDGSATATPTPTPKPTCTPKPSPTATPTGSPAATPTPTASPTATATATSTATVHGRDEVAARVTLDAKLQAIVDKAKADMKAVADKALADLAALPTRSPKPTDHGKPAGTAAPNNGKKDEDHGRSGDHKPSVPVPSHSPRGRP